MRAKWRSKIIYHRATLRHTNTGNLASSGRNVTNETGRATCRTVRQTTQYSADPNKNAGKPEGNGAGASSCSSENDFVLKANVRRETGVPTDAMDRNPFASLDHGTTNNFRLLGGINRSWKYTPSPCRS